MRKFWLVLRHELFTTLTRPSFLFVTLGFPLIVAVLFIIFSRIQLNTSAAESPLGFPDFPAWSVIGIVDQSGLIQRLPSDTPPGALQMFPDEISAQAAIYLDDISAYYIVPADYLQTGRVIYVRPELNPLTSMTQGKLIEWVLQVNLLDGDEELARMLNEPPALQVVARQAEAGGLNIEDPATFFIPYLAAMILFFTISASTSLLLSGMAKERENRIIEILVGSLRPVELIAGKAAALGLAGLLQTAMWGGIMAFRLGRSSDPSVASALALSEEVGRASGFDLPSLPTVADLSTGVYLTPMFLLWVAVFFVLGYAFYAGLFAGIGTLTPNLREGSTLATFLLSPLMVPFFLTGPLLQEPNSRLAVFLSLFPPTAPTSMVTRLVASSAVPPVQIVASVVILAVTAALVLLLVSRCFRAQLLLTGQPLRPRRLWKALTRKG